MCSFTPTNQNRMLYCLQIKYLMINLSFMSKHKKMAERQTHLIEIVYNKYQY